MKLRFVFIALACAALAASAGVREEFKQDVHRSANNYLAYPDRDLPRLTPAPEGYEPFFIDHYARHGSRWLISPEDYDYPVEVLEQAQLQGCLSPRGEEVLNIAREVREASRGRLGELTDVGAAQHRGIARRMVENFPTVFRDGAAVDARSTVVIRCILSMQNEVNQLQAMCPSLKVTMDASEHDMRYMNFHDRVGFAAKDKGAPAVEAFKLRVLKPAALLSRLFTNKAFAGNVDGEKFMLSLFQLAANMQSHSRFAQVDLFKVFTPDEIYRVWSYNNAWWYVHGGDTELTGGRVPFVQANLLRDFIQEADRAVATGRRGAAMRFGHETMVLSLAALMQLDDTNYNTTNLETLAEHWQAYKIFPMACNIQLVFYRSDHGPVLVKALLNEHEARFPLDDHDGPYYRWSDVRDLFTARLNQFQP